MKIKYTVINRCFIIGLLVMMYLLSGCEETVTYDVIETSKVMVPFTNCEEDFPVPEQEEVPLYFIEDGHLPYIDIGIYLRLIDPMTHLQSGDIIKTNHQVQLSYDPVPHQYMFLSNQEKEQVDSDYRQTMIIDFDKQTVSVSSSLFFMFQGEQMIDPEEHINIVNTEITEGSGYTIPFGEYGFTFYRILEDSTVQYLIPFHVATLLFNNSTLYRTYYSGDQIIGGGRCIYDTITRTSSFNGTDIPDDIKTASLQLHSIALDYFSAIKVTRGVESYYERYLNELPTLLEHDTDMYYKELNRLLYQLDDLHAGLPATGYYASDPSAALSFDPSWIGPNRKSYLETYGSYNQKFHQSLSQFTQPPTVRLIGDDTIAVIYLYQFNESLQSDVKGYLDGLPDSVESVVVFLAINGGGKIHSIFELLGFMTDQPITFTNGIAIDNSEVTYQVEVEQEAYPYDWYILSSKATLSAAHIATQLAIENDIATVLGETTYGAASAIESILLPCGFSHTVSGNYTFYHNHESSELGVEPDYPLDNLWDDEELVALITQLQ